MFHVLFFGVGGEEEEGGGTTVGAMGLGGFVRVVIWEARQDYTSPITGHIADSSHTVLRCSSEV